MAESKHTSSLMEHRFQTSCRTWANRGFAIVLPAAWLVGLVFAILSNSLYLAVPIGGFFPLLFFVAATYLPLSPLPGVAGVSALTAIAVGLVYSLKGHPAGLLFIPLGYVWASLYLSPWPSLVGLILNGCLFFSFNRLTTSPSERLWRLNLQHLEPLSDYATMSVLAGIGLASLGLALYGRWLQVNKLELDQGNQNQLAHYELQLAELQTQLNEKQTQSLQLAERITEHERLQAKSENQLKELYSRLEAQQAETDRIRQLAEVQQQEHQRKLVQALSEGVLLRAITQASGVLQFRLNGSGEILSTNPAANELVRTHGLKQIGGWILPDQPQLAHSTDARNWKTLRSLLAQAPGLLRVRSSGNQAAWVWATVHAVENLTPAEAEEWTLLALELDARLQALAASQNLEAVQERERLALAQQEYTLRQIQKNVNQLQEQLNRETALRSALLSGLNLGVGLLRSLIPMEIIEANSTFLNLTRRPEQATGSNYWLESIELQLNRELNKSKPETVFAFTLQIQQAEAGPKVVRIQVSPLVHFDGQMGWLVVCHDLTRIQQAEQLFEQVAESSPTPFLIAGMSSRKLIYVNSSLCAVLGYTPEELVELSPDDLFADNRRRAELIVALKRTGHVEGHAVLLETRDRRTIRCLCTLRVAQLLGERCILGSFVPVVIPQHEGQNPAYRSIGGWTLDLGTLNLEMDGEFGAELGLKSNQWKLHEFMSQCLSTESSRLLNDLLSRMVKSQQVTFQQDINYELQTPTGIWHLEGTCSAVADLTGSLTACRAEHRLRLAT